MGAARTILIVLLLIILIRIYKYRSMAYKRVNRLFRSPPSNLPNTYTLDRFSPPTIEPNYSQTIPTIICQTVASRSLPLDLYETCMINRHMNPEYEYRIYENSEFEAFAREHYSEEHADAFQKLIPGAFKSDLMRCLLLYKFGGVYIDCKASTMIPLREMLKPDTKMMAFVDYTPNCIHNGFIASEPGHPLLKRVIDRILHNVATQFYGECQLDITGPMVWGREFNIMRGKDQRLEFEHGHYPEIGIDLAGTYLTFDKHEILMSKEMVPYVNRVVPGYYSVKKLLHPDHYAVRWYTKRVYKNNHTLL